MQSVCLKKIISSLVIMGIVILLTNIAFAAVEPLNPPLAELEKSFINVIKKVKPAVVDISTEKTITRQSQPFGFDNDMIPPEFRDFFRQLQPRMPQREKLQTQGSGVIVRHDGYILTNNHVVAGMEKVTVTLSDGRVKEAKIIGADENTDLAVIKIDGDNLPVIELGDSDSVQVGQIVFTFGSPFSFSGSVSQGIVSGLGRELHLSQYEQLIQTDAAMNPGNSGGPLVNLHGDVIGINKAIATRGVAQSAGIGFAIPINLARTVMGDLIQTGKWTRGYLGVERPDPPGIDEKTAKYLHLPDTKGVLVSKVIENSPAEKSGIKEYDFIIEFNGKKIESFTELANTVALTKVGEKVPIKVIRDGKPLTLYVVIAERTEDIDIARGDTYKKWGITVQTLTEELAKQKGFEFGSGGLLVTSVDPDSSAYDMGFRENDIILEADRKPIRDIKEFKSLVSEKKNGDQLFFRIRIIQGGYKFILFTVPESK